MSVIQHLEDTINYQASLAVLRYELDLTLVTNGNKAVKNSDIIYRTLQAVYVSSAFYNEMHKELTEYTYHRYVNRDGVFIIHGCPVYVVKPSRISHPDFVLLWQ